MSELHESKHNVERRQFSDRAGGAGGGGLAEAKNILPLEKLALRLGFDCPSENKSGFKCPGCGKKKASTRRVNGRLWFKCFNPECPTGTFAPHSSFGETRLIAYKSGLSDTNGRPGCHSDAAIEYMRLAGVWRESSETHSGNSNIKHTDKTSSPTESLPATPLPDPPDEILPPKSNPIAKSQPLSPETQSVEDSDSEAELGRAALAEFYNHLTLSQEDELNGFVKRGLTSVTMVALGIRSNPRTKQQLIEQMASTRGWPEMIASGLALPADPQRKLGARANSQFCGKGQAGKIPKAERSRPDHKTNWDWTLPPLIPYFNTEEKLVGLRPHKGGAPAGTAASATPLYIPRAFTPPFTEPEKFSTVIITEGEFKAAALWQTVGIGARQFVDEHKQPLFCGEAYGVCALPGISYAKNVEARMLLENWLKAVGCRHVIVAFDREEKGDPKLPAYEPDPERRYDSLIYAFYLASDLMQKLTLRAQVCLLPKAWMNAAGKADWDGALAALVHQQLQK